MSSSHHHHYKPPRDANAEASAVRGRLAWVRTTFSPMMMAASEGDVGAGAGGRSGSGSSPGARAVAASSSSISRSIAAQVVAAYSDILEELIADVAVEAHRAWRTDAASRTPAGVNLEGPPPLEKSRSVPQQQQQQQQQQQARFAAFAAAHGEAEAAAASAAAPPPANPAPPAPPAPPTVRLARVDAFGQPLKASSAGDVACPTCGRRVAAARFAPHLEKCLGGGRAAGRAARAAAR